MRTTPGESQYDLDGFILISFHLPQGVSIIGRAPRFLIFSYQLDKPHNNQNCCQSGDPVDNCHNYQTFIRVMSTIDIIVFL